MGSEVEGCVGGIGSRDIRRGRRGCWKERERERKRVRVSDEGRYRV